MEAPLYHLPVPIPAPGVPALPATLQQHDTTIGAAIHQQQQQQHQAAAVSAVITAQKKPPPLPPPPTVMATGREQCPRCASRDTKFCYYNNYNTAQPRHFCSSCRRYWTLGGSLRNVPVGGSTRKRPRPARPTRALAAAVATMSSSGTTTTTTTATAPSCSGPGIFGGSPVPAPAQAPAPAQNGSLLSSLLVGSTGASDLFAYPAFSAGQLLWPATVLDGDRAETTSKAGGAFPLPFPPADALWQELAAAMPSAAGAGAPQPQPQLLL